MLLLGGAAVLAASGCGSSGHTDGTSSAGAPARIVQSHISRLDRAFPGWRRLPPAHKHVCADTQGAPPAAGASRDYIYPPHQDYANVPYPYNEVVVSVGYRTPENAALHVAGMANPESSGAPTRPWSSSSTA